MIEVGRSVNGPRRLPVLLIYNVISWQQTEGGELESKLVDDILYLDSARSLTYIYISC